MKKLGILAACMLLASSCAGARAKESSAVQVIVLMRYMECIIRQESQEAQLEALRLELQSISPGFRIVSVDLQRCVAVLQEM